MVLTRHEFAKEMIGTTKTKDHTRYNFINSLVFCSSAVATVTKLAMRLFPRLEEKQKSYVSCRIYSVRVPKLDLNVCLITNWRRNYVANP